MTGKTSVPPLHGWTRVRRAYLDLIAESDPIDPAMVGAALDLRPGFIEAEVRDLVFIGGTALISGPDDLSELRTAVERMTGPNTWPIGVIPSGLEVVAHESVRMELPLVGPALGLVMAMNGLIDDRSRAWRTWRTVVDSVGRGLETVDELTIDTLVVASAG